MGEKARIPAARPEPALRAGAATIGALLPLGSTLGNRVESGHLSFDKPVKSVLMGLRQIGKEPREPYFLSPASEILFEPPRG
jgi:hypothetical protein